MDQAEQLRKMVSMQSRPKSTARVITITSGKGGVGKTSLSVNLAINLSRMGKRVMILDADFGLANIEVMLGIRPQYNLADLMYRGKSLQEIITNGPENIGFISGGSGIQELSHLSKEQVIYLVKKLYELDECADIIIVDTGAGITDPVIEFVAASSEVLLVATPEPTSITDAYALLKTLNRKTEFSAESTSIKLISNKIKSEEDGEELFNKLSLVSDKFLNIKLEYLGGIPQDELVSKAIMHQVPTSLLYPHTDASKAIASISAMLMADSEVSTGEKSGKGIVQLFSNLIKSTKIAKNRK